MSARTRAVLAAAALALLGAGSSRAAGGGSKSVPAWVREAMARDVSAAEGTFVILHEEAVVEPEATGGVRVTTRMAGKVLQAGGREELEGAAFVRDRDDVLVAFHAWNLTPGGEVRTPEKEDFSDDPYTSAMSVHESSRMNSVGLPGVVVGSVTAFEWTVVEALDRGAFRYLMGHPHATTAFSRATLRVPSGWKADVATRRAEGVAVERGEGSLTLTATNLRPLADVPLAPPDDERLPLAWLRWWSTDGSRGFSDWNAVARWFRDLSEPVMKEAGEAAALGKSLAPAAPAGLTASLERAFDFAARQVRYVSIQVGIGGYRPDTPQQTCTNRHGDCKAKSFLVRSLAADWGVRTFPVLVATSGRGPLLPEVPSPAQFNHCIVGVLLPEGAAEDAWTTAVVEGVGRVLFMDATAEHGRAFDLPEMDQGTTALLVHETGGALVKLPVQPPEAGRTAWTLDAKLDDQGTVVEGTLATRLSGTQASSVRGFLARLDEGKRAHVRALLLQRVVPGATMTEATLEGLEGAGDLTSVTKLVSGKLGKRVYDELYVEPVRTGLVDEAMPPPPRELPTRVGPPREDEAVVTFEAPPGWRPEELPPEAKLETAWLTARGAWTSDGARLTYRRTARLLVDEVPAEQYGAFREAVLALQAMDRRAVVLVASP